MSALSRLDEDETEALPAAIDARRTLTTLLVSHHRDVDTHRRKEWIHLRERPSPLITKLTRPPKDSSFIAALRTLGGALETDDFRRGLLNLLSGESGNHSECYPACNQAV